MSGGGGIRMVDLPGTAIATSCLGMGCASLGSRIAPAAGRTALDMAFERGVRWFDVAPAYGAGNAEEILGGFLQGRRDRVQLCTKVGLAPPRHNGALRLVYQLGRPLAARFTGLRRRFRAVSATRNQHMPLTPETIENSIAASLRRLRTDHVDVFALHDPDPADLGRDDVLAALDGLVARGLARHISVAGSLTAARAALSHPGTFSLLQIADDPVVRPVAQLKAAGGRGFITHSVFGVGAARERTETLARTPPLARMLEDEGYAGGSAVADLLLDRAFAANPDGVVLASMFSRGHLEHNAARAALQPRPQSLALVDTVLARAA